MSRHAEQLAGSHTQTSDCGPTVTATLAAQYDQQSVTRTPAELMLTSHRAAQTTNP